jgi:hypothetical protein
MNKSPQRFVIDGYIVIDNFLSKDEIHQIDEELQTPPAELAADRRLLDREWCRLIAHVVRHRLLKLRLLSLSTQPVLCTYFAKNETTNWGVGLHRDLHVPLRERIDGSPWTNWSDKQKIPHAQAPRDFLSSMLAVQVNLDDCAPNDGGLCVVPGSHLSADVTAERIECLGSEGCSVVMSPLMLHASAKSTSSRPRRVLHFLYGPKSLPGGAQWYYSP